MSVLTAILLGLAAFILACFQKIVADDFKAWRPRLVEQIIAAAVRHLPANKQSRYSEEWTGHVDEMPGDIAKLVAALGCLLASWRISQSISQFRKRCLDMILVALALALLGPLMALIAISIKLDSPGPVFSRKLRAGRSGKHFQLLFFRTRQLDGRQTELGRLLARTNMDLVPHLVNVLRGQLTLVGPRVPESPGNDGNATALRDDRPAIVGLWSFGEVDASNLEYSSLRFQLKILIATVGAVAFNRARHSRLDQSFRDGVLVIVSTSLLFVLLFLFGDIVIL